MATTGPALSSAGLGSGLDVNTIVSKLMAVESRPLTLLQTQATGIQTTMSAIGKLQSHMADLRDKAQAVTSATLWNGTTVASSDDTIVAASPGASSAPGSYQVEVQQLAAAQRIATAPLPTGAAFSAGTLHIELGQWTTTPAPVFDARPGTRAVDITIGPDQTSITAVRDRINAANAGVSASILNDGGGARLVLRSTDTGATSGFRITADETVDDGDASTGLSALAYDANAPSPTTTLQTARDARFSIDGVALTSPANTVKDVVGTLSLTLKKTTAEDSPITIDVQRDTESYRKAINDFVASYNTMAGFLRTATAYNAGTKTGGPLQGDGAAVGLLNQMRGALNAPSSLGALSSAGISMQSDGSLKTDATRLATALAQPRELQKLLAADGATTETTGFVRRFQQRAAATLEGQGVFATRNDSLRARQTANTRSQDALNMRLAATEHRLRAQYTALDKTMAGMTSLAAFVARISG